MGPDALTLGSKKEIGIELVGRQRTALRSLTVGISVGNRLFKRRLTMFSLGAG